MILIYNLSGISFATDTSFVEDFDDFLLEGTL